MKKTERIDKILGNMGYGSRREIKQSVKNKVVLVNGLVVKDSGMQVNPEIDEIMFRGEKVVFRKHVYIMLNKPQGVISATEDQRDRTVLDLLDPSYRHYDLFPVGRLDKDTEGLLLLTNNGALAHNLLSPKKHVPKTYYVEASGHAGEEQVKAFTEGVTLEDGYRTLPAQLTLLPGECSYTKTEELASESSMFCASLTIREGKFHQVKRMFMAVGCKVTYLKRISMGSLVLDDSLIVGEYRELTEKEINKISGVE